jgi:hypothetical protein
MAKIVEIIVQNLGLPRYLCDCGSGFCGFNAIDHGSDFGNLIETTKPMLIFFIPEAEAASAVSMKLLKPLPWF